MSSKTPPKVPLSPALQAIKDRLVKERTEAEREYVEGIRKRSEEGEARRNDQAPD